MNNRLRVNVTARNETGSTTASSQPTAVVTPPEGATRLADGRYSIPASSVRLPNRLVISGVEFVPSVIRSRNPYTGRFRVTDTRGYVVRDAIVLVTGVPLGWIQAPQEVRTNVDGLATIQIQPTRPCASCAAARWSSSSGPGRKATASRRHLHAAARPRADGKPS